jgi:hypothetical protein
MKLTVAVVSGWYNQTPAELAENVGLTPLKLEFVTRNNFPLLERSPLHLTLEAGADHSPSKKVLWDELRRRLGLSPNTIRRGTRGKAIDGISIIQLAIALGVRFDELADPLRPEPSAPPGPKRKGEALQRICDGEPLGILYGPWGPLWVRDTLRGLIPEQVLGSLERNHVAFSNPVWAEEPILADAFVQGLGGDVLITTLDQHPLARHLQLVLNLVWMPITVLGAKRRRPQELRERLGGSLPYRIAVFEGGFSSLKLMSLGVPSGQLVPVKFMADAMADKLLGGEGDFAVANRHSLLEVTRRGEGLLLDTEPLADCCYSIWVRKEEQELAKWLRKIICAEQDLMEAELEQFRRHHSGRLIPLRHGFAELN